MIQRLIVSVRSAARQLNGRQRVTPVLQGSSSSPWKMYGGSHRCLSSSPKHVPSVPSLVSLVSSGSGVGFLSAVVGLVGATALFEKWIDSTSKPVSLYLEPSFEPSAAQVTPESTDPEEMELTEKDSFGEATDEASDARETTEKAGSSYSDAGEPQTDSTGIPREDLVQESEDRAGKSETEDVASQEIAEVTLKSVEKALETEEAMEKESSPPSKDDAGDSMISVKETVLYVSSDSAEQEEYECPFCVFMRAGPCRAEFDAWDKCVENLKHDGSKFIEACAELTHTMKECMETNSEYYAPILEVERAMEEEENSETESLGEASVKTPVEASAVSEASDTSTLTDEGKSDDSSLEPEVSMVAVDDSPSVTEGVEPKEGQDVAEVAGVAESVPLVDNTATRNVAGDGPESSEAAEEQS